MATLAQTFWLPGSGRDEWDGTDPAGGDIRKLLTADPGATTDVFTECSFGTAAASIICDPYTLRNTTGLTGLDTFGWALNLTGADGVDSVAGARRIIPAGTWTFYARLGTAVAALGSYTTTVTIYRRTAAGARTSLFSATSTGISPTNLGTAVPAWTSAQPQITLEAGETLFACYYLSRTASGVTAESIAFQCAPADVASRPRIVLPAPGLRTLYDRSMTDGASASDAVTKQVNYRRTLSEAAAAADAVTRRVVVARNLADTAAASDAVTRQIRYVRQITDNIGPTGGGGTTVRRPILIFDD